MKQEMENTVKNNGERGAAMVMALLVSFLLLVASAGLLLESSTNSMNVTDATAEQQAYNAAESGIQSAVHVLRDNITLADADRIDPTKPATDKANRIDFRKALKLETSNLIDPSLCTGPPDSQPVDFTPRLSRWLDYHDTEVDRFAIGSGTYDRRTGHAYSPSISDPDNTGNVVTFSTTGRR